MNIHAFWQAVLQQNEQELLTFFHSDAVIRWPCTNERFTAKDFIHVNCAYPGSWDGEMERLEHQGDQLITVMRVFSPETGASFHAVSFITLRDDRIAAMTEYWSADGPAPAWRQAMGIGTADT